jgi:fructose-bisphosphate aldolase class I
MDTLAKYAALCQEVGIVPIIEPEVLMDGDHNIVQCFEVTTKVLHVLFNQLYKQQIALEGMLLKPNMVTAGKNSIEKNSIVEVAEATIKCLLECVPAAVPGITFLSGGQSSELASYHLNEMNRLYKSKAPWALAFSFSRAIQLPALEIWQGKEENKVFAQQELLYRAKCNSEARWGEYDFVVEPIRGNSQ